MMNGFGVIVYTFGTTPTFLLPLSRLSLAPLLPLSRPSLPPLLLLLLSPPSLPLSPSFLHPLNDFASSRIYYFSFSCVTYLFLFLLLFSIFLSLVILTHFSFSYCFLYFLLLWYLLISLSLSLTVSYFYFSCVTNVLFSLSFTVLFPCFRSVVLLTHLSFSRCFLFLFLFKGQFHKISYPIFYFKNATMGLLWTILIRRFFNCAEIRFNTVQYLQRVGRHSCWAWWHCLRVVAFDYRRTMWPLHKDCKFLSCSLSLT